jgi:peptidoglycan/LPS O-acetylase OafA/YrhL
MWTVSILFIILIVVSIAIPNNKRAGMTKGNTNAIRGILAYCVVLSHFVRNTEVSYYLPFCQFQIGGVVAVPIFFVLSGYGLMKGFLTKRGYMDHFFAKRLNRVLLPYFVFLLVYYITVWALSGFNWHVVNENIMKCLVDGYPPSNSWYVIIILIFYALFDLCSRRATNSKLIVNRIIVEMTIIILLFSVILYVIWPQNTWAYRSNLFFVVGICYAIYQSEIENIVNKNSKIIVPSAIIFVIISLLLPAIYNQISTRSFSLWVFQDVLVASGFSFIAFIVIHRVNLENKVTSFLGYLSYEIYLFHGFMMEILSRFNGKSHYSQEVYSLLVVISTIFISYIFNVALKGVIYKARKCTL